MRLELEERVVTQMQKGLIHDKDAKYSKHLAGKMATLKKERVGSCHAPDGPGAPIFGRRCCSTSVGFWEKEGPR